MAVAPSWFLNAKSEVSPLRVGPSFQIGAPPAKVGAAPPPAPFWYGSFSTQSWFRLEKIRLPSAGDHEIALPCNQSSAALNDPPRKMGGQPGISNVDVLRQISVGLALRDASR